MLRVNPPHGIHPLKAAKIARMWRVLRLLVLAVAVLALFQCWSGRPGASPEAGGGAMSAADAPTTSTAVRYPAFLPPEAVATLETIEHGGPFPYPRDGVEFQNREHRLPEQARGYYHEYTVTTPGSADRGARRVITGGNPPEAWYYTDDHYRSFRRVEIER
jgi:ribonuclease T1